MPNINDAFPSKFLRASDLPDEGRDFSISDVAFEPVGQGDDAKDKLVVYFDGEKRGLVLNKTNASTIAELYGPDTDEWEGQSIVLFPSQTDYQGKTVDCIRVRRRKPKAEAKARPAAPIGRPIKPAKVEDEDDSDIPF